MTHATTKPDEPWRRELHAFARKVCDRLQRDPRVLGIALGGSLARGTEWPHSDVEVGILVDERITELGHFNVLDRRGYEVFQLIRSKVAEQVKQAQSEPLTVNAWPIQMF